MASKIVVVKWVDSKGTHRWEHEEEASEPIETSRCVSVGFLWRDRVDEPFIELVGTQDAHNVLGRLQIPRVAITEPIREIGVEYDGEVTP